MARTDMLIGLFNRNSITEFVDREIALIKQTKDKSFMVMLDLDHFKSINDNYGHPNDDIVLKRMQQSRMRRIS